MINGNWRWSLDLEIEILSELKGCSGIVHVCSGASGIGDYRIDRFWDPSNSWKVETHGKQKKNSGIPNIRADMCMLPVRSGTAGAVVCDPPYSYLRFSKYFRSLVDEVARITAPGGKVLFVFPSIFYHPTLTLERFWCRPAGDKFVPTYKILSVSTKKNFQLTDY